MPLVTMNEVLVDAQTRRYAIPAFNVCNLEYIDCIFTAAHELKAPVIIAIHPVETEHAGLEEITGIIRTKARCHPYPVVMHLDHGDSYERAVACVMNGFTSVMYDGSVLPFEENIANTREVVRMAHAAGVSVEGELGLVGGNEGDSYAHAEEFSEDQLTNPETAVEFVAETGIDSLAVAIGTAHGFYKGEPRIDLDRLSAVKERVSIPLVLHGGSGTPRETILESVRRGICKINISSEFKRAYHEGLVAMIDENRDEWDPLVVIPKAKEHGIALLKEKLELFGAAGKA